MKAAKESLITKKLDDYEQGTVTLWQAAESCGLSVWEMILETRKREIQVPYTLEEFREDLKGLRESC